MRNAKGEMRNEDVPDIVVRTFDFGVRIVKLCSHLHSQRGVSFGLIDQLARCGTSIGANVEEAQGAQSRADFISKISIATKEARETEFRLRIFVAAGTLDSERAGDLCREANELTRVLGAISASAAGRRKAER